MKFLERILILVFVVVFGFRFTFGQGVPANATITGIILGDDGRPLKGAYVVSPALKGNPRSATRPDGVFSLTNLPGGTHAICVQVPGTLYLDPCRWSTPTRVTLAGNQTRAGLKIQLQKGARMLIQLDDANTHLQAHPAEATSQLLVGVFDGNGLFHRAALIGRGASRWSYALVVPPETPLTLSVHSRFFKIADSAGKQIAASAEGPRIKISGTGSPAPFSFNVLGTAN